MGNIIELYAVNGIIVYMILTPQNKSSRFPNILMLITSDEPINNQPSNSSSAITDSDYDNLQKLKTLLDDEMLTQEEFYAKLKSRFWDCILMAAYIKLYKIR